MSRRLFVIIVLVATFGCAPPAGDQQGSGSRQTPANDKAVGYGPRSEAGVDDRQESKAGAESDDKQNMPRGSATISNLTPEKLQKAFEENDGSEQPVEVGDADAPPQPSAADTDRTDPEELAPPGQPD